jgi:hypothetical protein
MTGKKGHSGRRSAASLRPPIVPWLSPTTGESLTRAPTVHELRDFKCLLMDNAHRLPDDVYVKLESLIDWLISREPDSMQLVHMTREWFIREGLRRGHKLIDLTAYDYAAKQIASIPIFAPAWGGAAAMKDSHEWLERRQHELGVQIFPALTNDTTAGARGRRSRKKP